MSKSKHQTSEFTFVGQLSDCIISKKAQIKYLKIATETEKNWIKLSKKSRENMAEKIIPGAWLKVKGQRKICLKTGIIELKADTIEATTAEICDRTSNCDRCQFKRLVYSGSSSYNESSQDAKICYQLEEGLSKHFRIRGNFSIKKKRSQ